MQILHFLKYSREKIEWGDPFHAIFIDKYVEIGKNLQLFLSINQGHPSKNEEICSQIIVKLVFKMLKLVFKMLKLVLKTPKPPSLTFCLQEFEYR